MKKKPKKPLKLNLRERAVIEFLAREGKSGLAVISKACERRELGPAPKNSVWVRNAVRKPLREGLIVRIGKGEYRATNAGQRAVTTGEVRRAALRAASR